MPLFAEDQVKAPRLAGSWYPAGKAELSAAIDGYFKAADASLADGKDIGVIIAPHAGYAFSGAVAATAYKAARNKKIRTVVLLAPSHTYTFKGASVWAQGAFRTPLGDLAVDVPFARKLLEADKQFVFRKDVFEGRDRPENSVETHIPFIQKAFPGASVVPVILGFPLDIKALRALADALARAAAGRDDVLVAVSVDQSHFHPEKEARQIDGRGLEAIGKMDAEALWNGHADGSMEVDGFHVVLAAMLYARAAGYDQARVLRYATSADTTGDVSSVVGYAAVMFFREAVLEGEKTGEALTQGQKKRLLAIARETVEAFVRTGIRPEFSEADPRLSAAEGAFVTLHKDGRLRGCIGHITGQGPLYETVRDMAVAAAAEDPRFDPVSPAELKDIDIEVSVLSVPRRVKNADEVILGTHGVIVSRGHGHGGVFLPQVATETGWNREKFLSELCAQKAGLPPDAWKDPATRIEVFTADVFGEKEKD
jgi:AmmeMemoRadiSam system protein B/AmmeMemoRadiSam system protein A